MFVIQAKYTEDTDLKKKKTILTGSKPNFSFTYFFTTDITILY